MRSVVSITGIAVLAVVAAVSCVSVPQPLEFPRDVGWRSVTVRTKDGREQEVKTLFVARGDRWYFRRVVPEGKDMVVVSDGREVAANVDLPDQELSVLDLRKPYSELYESLPAFEYLGAERIDGRKTWHYALSDEDLERHLWIDAETLVPRRQTLRTSEATFDERLFDLPESFEVTPDLFGTGALERKPTAGGG